MAIALDARNIGAWPHHDASAVALQAHPGNVESVLINGEWHRRDGVLVGTDVASVQLVGPT
ncbi:hypothetical protein [Rhodococcoides corynebacterioides]|uniref:hypothetical protein n=1 Tax=Rhodococcoides corynebacterioides TaxID=53972 RepID=UPI001C9B4AE1|nr:hypothetical protein [Rhodococcus corynebacterioides]MBY6364622.1 hypothetical protein [Rhodococcus corynebacterioides]